MEESNESKVREDRKQVDECRNVFTKTIKAGKRTYFFDVKCGKNENHFLTITESRKRVGKNGTPVYNKSKIFLFNKDIDRFIDILSESAGFLNGDIEPARREEQMVNSEVTDKEGVLNETKFTDINFEDLDE